MEFSLLQIILQADLTIKIVLAVLFVFSAVSWAIIFYKWSYFKKANQETHSFLRAYRTARTPKDAFSLSRKFSVSPLSNLFKTVYSEKDYTDMDEFKRRLSRYGTLEAAKVERHLGFLATTSAATPLIGLFGTVWGIMNAFIGIGAVGMVSLAVIAPGIAQALITTAAGLAAAIPAVVAYNYYLGKANHIIIEMEDFSAGILLSSFRSDEEWTKDKKLAFELS